VPEETIACSDCGDEHNVVYTVYCHNDSTNICDSCAEDTVIYCEFCSEYLHDVDFEALYDGITCEACLRRYYTRCAYCDMWTHNDYIYYSERNDAYYCEDHYSDGGEYENILDWGDDPSLVFTHYTPQESVSGIFPEPGMYYLGVEIELEDAAPVVNDYIYRFRKLYAKTDSSLGDEGVEVVSHPGTLDAWNHGVMIDWDDWQTLIHNNVGNNGQYGSNGIHVHVSRTAFNHKRTGRHSASHLYRFMQFIQNHQRTIQHFAGRDGNRYCRWDLNEDLLSRKSEALRENDDTERYRPINTQNDATIELRFFDGRSDALFIHAAVQFVHAVVEFTRDRKFKDDRSWRAFMSWVNRSPFDYAALTNRLRENQNDYVELAEQDQIRIIETKERVKAEKIRREQERQAALSLERQLAEFRDNYVCDCGREH
jgi:hypothetical protein